MRVGILGSGLMGAKLGRLAIRKDRLDLDVDAGLGIAEVALVTSTR